MSTDVAHARRTDPMTSHEAAWSLGDLSEKQGRVLALFDARTVATDAQLRAHYQQVYGPVAESTVRTRRRELQDLGLVVLADTKGVTSGGRSCRRYRLR